ncbi:MAG: hypothetical protein NTV39_00805 [Candidatus Saccharibacteria bacterium]|nr:hypothetical protein [Candidatus Saccharibacteria bacterium]
MKKTILFISLFSAIFVAITFASVSYAQPYGKGVYGANVPYGNQTSLSISTDGNVNIPVTPTTGGVSASGSSQVTVSSTDVMGYKLYIRALNSTDMDNLGTPLPTSANASPAPLAVNTWGYNIDASNNFTGISLADVLIHSKTGPISSESTNVTFGIKIDLAKPAGNFVASVVYTAVPQTD